MTVFGNNSVVQNLFPCLSSPCLSNCQVKLNVCNCQVTLNVSFCQVTQNVCNFCLYLRSYTKTKTIQKEFLNIINFNILGSGRSL